MNESYLTVAGYGRDEITIQKSRFIGQAWPCANEEEALAHLNEARNAARDARHHCYAYVIGQNESIIRYSDDGEPGGTAGMPMISLIRSEKLVNCCCVVTRYFGGVLLGTGGLVRAYTEGCRIALKAAGLVRMELSHSILCEVPYGFWDSVRYAIDKHPAKVQDVIYGASVFFKLLARDRDRNSVLENLIQVSARKLVIKKDEERYEAWEIS